MKKPQLGYRYQLQELDQILWNDFLKFDLGDQNFPILTSQLLALHRRHQKQDNIKSKHRSIELSL